MAVGAVAVVGIGPMGLGWLSRTAAARFPVLLRDLGDPPPAVLRARLEARVAAGLRTAELDEAAAGAVLAQVECCPEALALEECDLVLEAVEGGLHEKTRLFRGLEEGMARGAVLASCSASLPVERYASRLARPEQFLGIALGERVGAPATVALRTTPKTAPGAAEAVRNFVRALGLVPLEAPVLAPAKVEGSPRGWWSAAAGHE